MERSEQLRVVEALILASPEPLSATRISQITPECTADLAKDLVGQLNARYEEHENAFEIWEVAGGYQVRTRAEFSGYLQQLQKQRPLRLSRAALETLAIVAYKQPATRAEVEYVRGVDVGATFKSLMDRGLVKITGQKEVPGRPMLYGTTRRFLDTFGLDSLKSLPELRELEELAREHDAKGEAGEGEAGEMGEVAEVGEGDGDAHPPDQAVVGIAGSDAHEDDVEHGAAAPDESDAPIEAPSNFAADEASESDESVAISVADDDLDDLDNLNDTPDRI